ncbi:2,3-diphosphoglycerate-dependent phosphoglycerate mutase [Babesia caballi]|uniref:phosphoglycerate mutase (2,3-diphosphoglycerate-dependent) n=1 Tax=Babesia caballi TaxID=5871 RepID=A0AAV4LNW3_BABCB|nr:2,3-diphosphoglycerate-dependent phosphoglycerate mutase [Babesia caballi]
MITVVFVRHGESAWNKENRFCGWVDQPLTEGGEKEARDCGESLKEAGYDFGAVYTSVLKRAIHTADIITDVLGKKDIPTFRSWRLNERHYGGLQGLNKAETVEKYSLEQVNLWRRSYNTPPPPAPFDLETFRRENPMYDCIPDDEIPNGESLEMCVKRTYPYWRDTIAPQLKPGVPVLIVAHGNAIRALIKVIENLSDTEISSLNVPNGVPIVYTFTPELKFVEKKFLISEEELQAKVNEVANQLLKK